MKLLVIEDNTELLKSIYNAICKQKFLCEIASDFYSGIEKIHLYNYDIVIVDINLPGGSGIDIIKELKQKAPQTGIIVISARNSTSNKIEGLELGADDYITKPFELSELIARIKSLLRRSKFGGSNFVEIGKITINTEKREVIAGNHMLHLTKSEYDILLFFASNPDKVISKESLAEHIWGDNMDLVDSFDFVYSHIKNLRKKIEMAKINDPIKAVYGIGYIFSLDN